MRRNQPSRSKRSAERGSRPAAEHPAAEHPAAEHPGDDAPSSPLAHPESSAAMEQSVDSSAVVQRVPVGLTSLVCLIAVVIVFCGLIILLISMRWRTDTWPTAGDVGVVPLIGSVGAGLLVAASVAAWLARKAARSGNRLLAKTCLLLALVGAIGFLLLRSHEYRNFHDLGIWQRSTDGPIHERADLDYVQAVRFRLADLFYDLDDCRVNRPNEFSDENAERLELVANLQANMVHWTEQEVGHWAEDLQHRRAVMELVAYQIHPTARNQAAVASNVQTQVRHLERQLQWFRILRDYCEEKSELLGQERKVSKTDTQKSVEAASEEASVSDGKSIADLDRNLKEKLGTLGLEDWSYAASVIVDTSDLAMAGERLNQVTARLDAMQDRAVFLDDLKVSFLGSPETEGLNREYPWLRLPICLPSGNAWASGYLALTGLHLALVGAAALLSLFVILVSFDSGHITRWRHVEWWWHATSLIGVVLLLLFYVF